MKKYLILLLFLTKLNYLAAMEGNSAAGTLTEESSIYKFQVALATLPQAIWHNNWPDAFNDCKIIVEEYGKIPKENLSPNQTYPQKSIIKFKGDLFALARGLLSNNQPFLAAQTTELFILLSLNCATKAPHSPLMQRYTHALDNTGFQNDIGNALGFLGSCISRLESLNNQFSLETLANMHTKLENITLPIFHINPRLDELNNVMASFGLCLLKRAANAGEINQYRKIFEKTQKYTRNLATSPLSQQYIMYKQSLHQLKPLLLTQ